MVYWFIDFGGWIVHLPFLGIAPRPAARGQPTTIPRATDNPRQGEQGRELDPVATHQLWGATKF